MIKKIKNKIKQVKKFKNNKFNIENVVWLILIL